MFKKFVSVMLAGLMLFSFAAVALAEGEDDVISVADEAVVREVAGTSSDVSVDKEDVKQLVEKLKEVAGEYKDYHKTLPQEKKTEIKDTLKDDILKLRELRQEARTLREGIKQKRDEIKSLWPEAKKNEELKDDVKAIKIELKNLHDATVKLRITKLNLRMEFFQELIDGKVGDAEQTLQNIIHYKTLINANLKAADELLQKAVNLLQ